MLVHNEYVVKKLEKEGFEIIEEEDILEKKDKLKDGDVGIIRAHGTSEKVYNILKEKNIKIYDSEYRDVEKKGTVTSNVNMRLGASTLSKKVTYLKKGTVIKIESKTSNGWYKIEYKGRDGYISQKHAKIGTNTNKKDYTYREMDDYDGITTAKLTLRRSPSSSSTKITSIPKGARVEVEGTTSNGFYRVEYRDIEGYVSSKYIKLVRDYD